MKAKISSRPKKVLDFDIETVAAGFADPNWVPQRVTCIAWSWCGQETVYCTTRLIGPEAMYRPFLKAYAQADMVTGHNIIRFDLPVLNADLMRAGLPPLEQKEVQDTMRFVKTKGFKKGQDNLGTLLELAAEKFERNWQQWEDDYQWDELIAGKKVSWNNVKKRCKSDVVMHKQMREEMLARGWLKSPTTWKP